MKRWLWFRYPLIIIVAACLIISFVFFLHGSLEIFPTVEQQSKTRVVMGSIALGLTLLLAFLCVLGIRKKPEPGAGNLRKTIKKGQ
jgi:hypothetical protein